MSDWSGGYGDALTPDEVIDRLHRASAHQVLKFHSPTEQGFDDLVQEGTIAGWRASTKAKGDPVAYGAVSARRRISDLSIKSAPMLGSESSGPRYDPMRHAEQRAEEALDDLLLAAPELLDAVEWSYHRGSILAVLNTMPLHHREYVYQRFWLGMTDAEIAAHKGASRDAVKSMWNRTIKPALRRELAHLR